MNIAKFVICLITGVALGGISINSLISGDTLGGVIVGIFAIVFLAWGFSELK